ncbi:MAG: hypothetical protein ACTSRA_19725 [Promethearchaeota archaeon]
MNKGSGSYEWNVTAGDHAILSNFNDTRPDNAEGSLSMEVTSLYYGTKTLRLLDGTSVEFERSKTGSGTSTFSGFDMTLDTAYTAVVVFDNGFHAHALKMDVTYETGSSSGNDDDDDDGNGMPIDDLTLVIAIGVVIGSAVALGSVIAIKKRSKNKKLVSDVLDGFGKEKDKKEEKEEENENNTTLPLTIQPKKKIEVKKTEKLKQSTFVVPPDMELTPEEKREIQQTESEMDIEKSKFICVVHKGTIDGAVYICPKCQTFYCVKCANVLKDKGEKCWSCENEITIAISDSEIPVPIPELLVVEGLSPEIQKKIQQLEEEITSLNVIIQKLDIKFNAGTITQEEYMKDKLSLSEKLGSLMGQREMLQQQKS